jgi:serine-type D-Ala-D-Ala carboxypeptidase/endopeptidase (penicillin-binding protein 4)
MTPRRHSTALRCALGALALGACFLGSLQSAAARDAALPVPVAEAVARARLGAKDASFFVQEIGIDKPVLAVQADLAQNPASTIKLITTYAALELLGPTYTWKTQFVSEAPIVGDVLMGDLRVRASGDPQFLWEHLWQVLTDLRNGGVREIRGDLVIDRSVFAPIVYDDGAFDGDRLRAYNVGPDALMFNYKATALHFAPLDNGLSVWMEPRVSGMAPRVDVQLVDGPCLDWRSRLQGDFSDPAHPAITGEYPRDCASRTWYLNLWSHDEYMRQAFTQLWTELGGVLRPDFAVRSGPIPAGVRLLAERTSAPLAEQIREVNKYSNNVMARQIFLALSTEPKSAEAARQNVSAWLTAKGIDIGALILENGSGLSRIERTTARMMGAVLQSAYHSVVMPEFVASMPILGLDGTMRKRLTTEAVVGSAHIKTGSLADTRAIAGYVQAASGRRYVVVSIISGPHAIGAQAVHDALLRWVYTEH